MSEYINDYQILCIHGYIRSASMRIPSEIIELIKVYFDKKSPKLFYCCQPDQSRNCRSFEKYPNKLFSGVSLTNMSRQRLLLKHEETS